MKYTKQQKAQLEMSVRSSEDGYIYNRTTNDTSMVKALKCLWESPFSRIYI